MTHPVLKAAVAGVQALQPYTPGKPIGELERELGIRHAIKLASNENPLGPSAAVLEALRGELAALARYPDGNGFALKSALSDRLGIAASGITLGNGSNDILELVARAFLSTRSSAVFSAHAFAIYPLLTQAIGARGNIAPAHDGSRGPEYGHDLEAMLAAVDDDTRVIFIANPNNPTGTWVNSGALCAFLERVAEDVIVVVDEAYFEYVDEADYPQTLPWIETFPNLLVTRTFSKAYGLASLRVGYGVSQPALADVLNRVRQPFNVNGLALAAAVAALGDADHLADSIAVNRRGLRQLNAGLQRLGLDSIRSAANFICVNVGRDPAAVYAALLREGIIVRPVDNYDLPGYLRISIGLPEENQACLDALARVLPV